MNLFSFGKRKRVGGLELIGLFLDYNYDFERPPEIMGEDIKYELKCFEYFCFLYSEFDTRYFSKLKKEERMSVYKDVSHCLLEYSKFVDYSLDETMDIVSSRCMSYYNIKRDCDINKVSFFLTELLCDIDRDNKLSLRVYPETIGNTSSVNMDFFSQVNREKQVNYFLSERYPMFIENADIYLKKCGVR